MKKKQLPPISKKKTPAPEQTKRLPFLPRVILLFVFFGGLGTVGLYLYVDKTIVQELQYRAATPNPTIFSDSFTIAPGETVSNKIFVAELIERNYREVRKSTLGPGEFARTPASILVVPRFSDARESEAPLIALNQVKERYKNNTPYALVLEPQPLSYLGSGEQKTSNFTPLRDIPENMIQAVLSIEDERFYSHIGIDFLGVIRAIWINILAGDVVQGGSTVTQQLAKNLLFTPERTFKRKIFEALAALGLERRFNKEQILELYLNEVYLGQQGALAIHGVAAASKTYFGKALSELTPAECALLAGLIKAPSYYSPFRNLNRALVRKDLVLSKMHELGNLSPAAYQTALEQKITLASGTIGYLRSSPHYVTQVAMELEKRLGESPGSVRGLSVYSPITPALQKCGESAIQAGLAQIEQKNPKLLKHGKPLEAGLVAIEPFSGKIRAYVGGRNFALNQFDHVSQGKRQMGSSIKPFLYLTALDKNLNNYRPATTADILPDEEMSFELSNGESWNPENYDHKFRGDVSLRYALEHSLNIPAAYLATRVGLENFALVLKNAGLAEQPLAVPSLALGTLDSSLLRVTAAFAMLANGGRYIAPRLYLSAKDEAGKVITQTNFAENTVADERAVYVLTDILRGVLVRGTATSIRNDGYTVIAAVKRATSNDSRDSWFVGYLSTLAAGVWVGFDDNTETGLTGGSGAAIIWAKFMKCAENVIETPPFLEPEGIVHRMVDSQTGALFDSSCSGEQVPEIFVAGTEPTTTCGGDEPSPPDDERARANPATRATRRERSFWDIVRGQ